jgi:hypothetical protein
LPTTAKPATEILKRNLIGVGGLQLHISCNGVEDTEWKFDMFTTTKQDSIIIAVTLGVILSLPLLIPAFYPTTEITGLTEAAPSANDRLARHSVRPKELDGHHVDPRVCKSLRIAPDRAVQI